MKTTTSLILCFVFLLLCPLPTQAQHKYYAHGQEGLSVFATYTGYSTGYDFSYSSGIGTVLEATFANKFSLGAEFTWRREDDIPGVITRGKPDPDFTAFVAIPFKGTSPDSRLGIDIKASYTKIGSTKEIFHSFDPEHLLEIFGHEIWMGCEFYRRFKPGSSFRLLPSASLGCQTLSTNYYSSTREPYEGSRIGITVRPEVSLLFHEKFILSTSVLVFWWDDRMESLYQVKLGVLGFGGS